MGAHPLYRQLLVPVGDGGIDHLMPIQHIEAGIYIQRRVAEEVDLETTLEDAILHTTSFQDWPLAFRVILP